MTLTEREFKILLPELPLGRAHYGDLAWQAFGALVEDGKEQLDA
jgi:hypothetical protein